MSVRAENASGFLADAQEWFALLKARYAQNLIEEFEKPTPSQEEVEKLGAKIAAIRDLLSDLRSVADAQRVADAYPKSTKE